VPGFAGVLRPLGIPLVSRSQAAAAGLERLLTVREVAAVLGVATSTVYRVCARGDLKCCRVSNAMRFSATDVTEFVRRRGARKGI
jgi:excisionase family DNA binding protein